MKNEDYRQDVTIDYSNVMESAVGPTHGLARGDFESLREKGAATHKWLAELKAKSEMGFFTLHDQDVSKIKKYAAKTREKFENFVVLGIGGSALGTTAVNNAVNKNFANLLTKRKRNGYPRLFVADNIDPEHFGELLSVLDPKKTLFNVISKSGATAETMSQFMVVFDMLNKKLKGKWKKKVVVTTDPKKGILREIVDEYKLDSFEVPPNVGGRFSVFSAVGLLPLACAGLNIDRLMEGSARMAKLCEAPEIADNPAYLFSAINYLADTAKKKPMVVMMPYSSRLYGIADWFAQLWGESLGKAKTRDGKEIHCGQTPIKALGATDQHSQVQLYVEGPADKIAVFIEVEKFRASVGIPEIFKDKPDVSYLAGSSMNELISVELQGTKYALTKHQRPNMTIKVPEINEYTVGQLIYMLEHATAFSGGLYNINPFDQPGVEFGKNFAYAMMGKDGYASLKAEIEGKGK
ncbi:MAG: glucose-6-phosphate isomerase [Nitrospinae bacterium]|nr:glucose-6-phosphate isomerase [Nitrospinota bacterium]